MADGDERTNSMCGIYAMVIKREILSESPDEETVLEMCEYIEQYCQTVGFEPGETPDHLEEYLFDGE
jgi:hypothetical protein